MDFAGWPALLGRRLPFGLDSRLNATRLITHAAFDFLRLASSPLPPPPACPCHQRHDRVHGHWTGLPAVQDVCRSACGTARDLRCDLRQSGRRAGHAPPFLAAGACRRCAGLCRRAGDSAAQAVHDRARGRRHVRRVHRHADAGMGATGRADLVRTRTVDRLHDRLPGGTGSSHDGGLAPVGPPRLSAVVARRRHPAAAALPESRPGRGARCRSAVAAFTRGHAGWRHRR